MQCEPARVKCPDSQNRRCFGGAIIRANESPRHHHAFGKSCVRSSESRTGGSSKNRRNNAFGSGTIDGHLAFGRNRNRGTVSAAAPSCAAAQKVSETRS